MELSEVRKEIDAIDSQLLSLFKQRMNCARQVAEIKAEKGLPILNPGREEEILNRRASEAGELGDSARVLFSTLMELSRSLQHQLLQTENPLAQLLDSAETVLPSTGRIACQGIADAYSHKAAVRCFPGCQPEFFAKWEDVFHALESGRADFGVLPVENSSAGAVSEVYDLILKYRYYIVGAVELTVNHCLAAKPGTAREEIRRVVSHPQALAQCEKFLKENGYQSVSCSNTAVAAQHVAEEPERDCAALCSETAAEHAGLVVLQHAVQDCTANCTRFVVVSRRLILPENGDKISLCFSLPHVTGSLYRVLARFAAMGLNLTKIESRPIAGKAFEYLFYLDFTGSVHSESTRRLLGSLSKELPGFSFLGNYRELV